MKFTKMHGLGNDYVYINGFEEEIPEELLPALAREISHRHFGVGSDGLILILPSKVADFKMRMFNADGSEGEMCGNGIRCLAKYVYERGLTNKDEMQIETLAGLIGIRLVVGDNGKVVAARVDMGAPRLRRSEIPMVGRDVDKVVDERITADGKHFFVTCLSMGNPHAVVFVDDIEEVQLENWGPAIETHSVFPQRTNVEFVQRLSENKLVAKVWERGSGATMACGTGACAATVAAKLKGLVDEGPVTVCLPGGELIIEWNPGGHVFMTGPCEEVFDGVYLKKLR